MQLRWGLAGVVAAAIAAIAAYLMGGLWERHILVAVINHASIADASFDGFKRGLEDLGYAPSRVSYAYAGPLPVGALEAEARRLVALKPDLLLSLSSPAAKAILAARQGTAIPLVFAPASDPVAAGLVDTLSHPGRNATGVTFGIQEPVRLQWLKAVVPSIRTLLVPYNPDDISPRASVEKLKKAAEDMEIRLDLRHTRNAEELEALLAAIPQEIDALFVPVDALIASQLPRIIKATMPRRIPVTVPTRAEVAGGALMSYGLDLRDLGRQAARLAAQILAGASAGDLPVETAEFHLIINMDTARKLDLTIDDRLLRQAEIIRVTEAARVP